MIIQLEHNRKSYRCDLSRTIDISIPVGQVKCFYATDYETQPYTSGDFVGSVKAGAPVNFFDVLMNPHGNGTHTECLGHITETQESINEQLREFHFIAQLISVSLEKNIDGDQIVSAASLKEALPAELPDALILRTLPNPTDKLKTDYSGKNPPFLEKEAMVFIVKQGVKHLLLDLPSVDKEVDGGKLVAHHLFWDVENAKAKSNTRQQCTITELVFVPNKINDGLYLLNLQIPSLNLDAAPSKPIIYELSTL